MPTTDIIAATRNLLNAEVVLQVDDIDGHLAPMIGRPASARVNAQGIWTVDAAVPRDYQRAIHRTSRVVIKAALTGGGALRGRHLLSSSIPDNRSRVIVAGTEGAEVLWPGDELPSIRPQYMGVAKTIEELSQRIASEVADLGLQFEPKGRPDLRLATTIHFSSLTGDKLQEAIGRLAPYVEIAEEELDLRAYLDADSNMNLSIGPPGLSKDSGMYDLFFEIEKRFGIEIDGLVFGGDGKTDLHACDGMDRIAAELTTMGRSLTTLKVAAMNTRTLSAPLADKADLVVRGAGVTTEMAMEIASKSSFDFSGHGIDPAAMGTVLDVMGVIQNRGIQQFVVPAVRGVRLIG